MSSGSGAGSECVETRQGFTPVFSRTAGRAVVGPFSCTWGHAHERLPSIQTWALQYSFTGTDHVFTGWIILSES